MARLREGGDEPGERNRGWIIQDFVGCGEKFRFKCSRNNWSKLEVVEGYDLINVLDNNDFSVEHGSQEGKTRSRESQGD